MAEGLVNMLSYNQALDLIHSQQAPIQTEDIAIEQSFNRVLAVDICLPKDQPSFDRSTMDGFAVKPIDGQRIYDVVGTVHAGEIFEGELIAGQAVRIMTGAPCPADVCVVPIELCYQGEDNVTIQENAPLDVHKNVALRGEDGHAGDVVAEAGTRLGAAVLSCCAMAGASSVTVFKNPSVAVVTTGDEVGGEGEAQICDSNGPLLAAFCAALDCEIKRFHAKDTTDGLAATLKQASEAADIVVTTGGVSAGSKDFVPQTANELGFATILHKVAIQPGKPILICQHSDGRFFVGLPGNPVSVLATAHLFLIHIIGLYWGGWQPEWTELPLINTCQSKKRHLFLPAALRDGGVDPARWNGSGDLIAAAACDGLINIPPDSSFEEGAMIPFLPFIGGVIGDRGILPPRNK